MNLEFHKILKLGNATCTQNVGKVKNTSLPRLCHVFSQRKFDLFTLLALLVLLFVEVIFLR